MSVFTRTKFLIRAIACLFKTDPSSLGYQRRVIVHKQNLAIIPVNVKQITSQHTAEIDMVDGICTALAFHNTAVHQLTSKYSKNRGRL